MAVPSPGDSPLSRANDQDTFTNDDDGGIVWNSTAIALSAFCRLLSSLRIFHENEIIMAEDRAHQSHPMTESPGEREERQLASLDLAELRTALEDARTDCARMAGKLLEAETEMLEVTRQWQKAEAEAARAGDRQTQERRLYEATIGQLNGLLDDALRHLSLQADLRSGGDVLTKAGLLNDKLAGQHKAKLESDGRSKDSRDGQSNQAVDGDGREIQHRLDERFREIAVLTKLLKQNQHEANREREQRQWLSAITAALLKQPWWWALLPKGWRNPRLHARLAKRGLFDADAYLALQPDVAASGIDPLLHYVIHGMNEGRARQ
jgi:hypothetical protein